MKAKRETSTRQAPTWLNDAVYEPRRQRTLAVVKQAVDTLLEQRKLDGRTRISLTTIVAMSKQQDPQGRGIAHTAILENAEAYTYDKKHRTAAPKAEKRSSQRDVSKTSEPTSSEDPSHAKRRWHYMTWHRAELVDELLRVQQERNKYQEQWLETNDHLLQWQLRAVEAEKQLEAKHTPQKNSRQ